MSSQDLINNTRNDQVSLSISEEVRLDFKLSFQAYRNNFRAFLTTELFAFLFLIIGIIITYMVIFFNTDLDIEEALSDTQLLILILGLLISNLVFQTFLTCQYGLAFDIMSSGDMFAEFKGAINYFKIFWWQYPLLYIIFSSSGIISQFEYSVDFFIYDLELQFMLYTPITFVWTTLFIETFPSLTAQKSLKQSFKENFYILRHNYKRLFATCGIFYLIFQFLPSILILLLSIFGTLIFNEIIMLILIIFLILIMLIWMICVGIPILTLLVTRIYNSVNKHDVNESILYEMK